jgi:maltoporin
MSTTPDVPAATPPGAAGSSSREDLDRIFRQTTEERDRAIALERDAPLRQRMEKVLSDFVDIGAYFRAGYGRNSEGGPQVGFQAPGAFAKYRLGNEAETYGEIIFSKNFYAPGAFSLEPGKGGGASSGPVAHVQLRLSVFNPYTDLLSSADTDVGLPEAWASIGNVVSGQPSMKFWAGNRFYRRHDIHINDFFFYNMSGAGGGMEDLTLPFGKLAIAWIGAASQSAISSVPEPDPENEAGFSKSNWDVRLYDVPLPLGLGEFGFNFATARSGRDAAGQSAPDSNGYAFHFVHTAERFAGTDSVNKFSLQFGTGAAMTFTSGFEQIVIGGNSFIRPEDDDAWRFRLTEHFILQPSDHFSVGAALVYQYSDYASQGGTQQWISAGVRPILHFNRYVSLAFEPGIDWVKDTDKGTSDYLYKLTIAPQVSLGGRFMSRPVLRGFVTYAHWGDDFVGQVGGNDFADRNDGFTYGVQMEVWW